MFTVRRRDVVKLGVKAVNTETRCLVGVQSQDIGRHVHTPATTDYDEVTAPRSTSAVGLDVAARVHRRDVGAQLQHSHNDCSSHTAPSISIKIGMEIWRNLRTANAFDTGQHEYRPLTKCLVYKHPLER